MVSRKKEVKYEPTPSAKDYLIALSEFPSYVRLLDSTNKSYEKLLLWVLENEKRLLNEDLPFPSMKEVGTESQVEYSKIAKHLKAIYDDVLLLNTNFPDKFVEGNQKLCSLTFEYLGNYSRFNLGFDVVPKVGEHVHFAFIKPNSGGDYFVVHSIYHSMENGKQDITIYLGVKDPILYLQLLKEKAYLNRRISSMDYIGSTSPELQKELIEMYKNL